MRSKLEAVRKRIDALSQTDALCANCAAGFRMPAYLEFDAVAGQPEPEIPAGPEKCLSPATCAAGGVRQIVIFHHQPAEYAEALGIEGVCA
jgi:hypothetical protein